MLEPLQSPTLQMYLGKELTEGLKRQLEGLTLEETRLDLTTKLRLRGRLRGRSLRPGTEAPGPRCRPAGAP